MPEDDLGGATYNLNRFTFNPADLILPLKQNTRAA
jgi:hypothetical protein